MGVQSLHRQNVLYSTSVTFVLLSDVSDFLLPAPATNADVRSCAPPPGDPRNRPDPLPPGSGAGLNAIRASTHGPGGSGTHAAAVHAKRSAHGEPHVCLPGEHGPAGHLLRE